MDPLKNLSREAQIVLGGVVLYIIVSFLDWQQVSVPFGTYGRSEWNGVGVFTGLLAIALLVWEAMRVFEVKLPMGTVTEGHVSAGLALALVLFTVITFATHGTARHWPAWIGLILSLLIAVAAVARARAEGVQLPQAKPAGATAEPAAAPAEPASAAPVEQEPEPEPPAPEAPAAPPAPEE
jgi:hypothetical protein